MCGDRKDGFRDAAACPGVGKQHLILLGCLVGGVLFAITVATVVTVNGDYPFHIRVASAITVNGLLHPFEFLKGNCYPVWHVLTWLMMKAFGCEGRTAAAFVSGACVVLTWLFALCYYARRNAGEEKSLLLVASVFLMLAAPIYLSFFNVCLVYGQWSPNIYQNPTHLMVRAVSLPCFMLYAAEFERIDGGSVRRLGIMRFLALFVLVLLAALSKPSSIQVFVPAISLLLVYEAWKQGKSAIKPLSLLGLTLLPAVALCFLQFLVSFYGLQEGANGIEVAFLKAWSGYSPCVPVSWFLATAFPLVMAAWAVRARRFAVQDAMAWLMLAFGLIEGALFAEKGPRAMHGNFLWGWALGLFFVWLVAMEKFISLVRVNADSGCARGTRWWFRAAAAVLSIHVLSGVWYLWRYIMLRIYI